MYYYEMMEMPSGCCLTAFAEKILSVYKIKASLYLPEACTGSQYNQNDNHYS